MTNRGLKILLAYIISGSVTVLWSFNFVATKDFLINYTRKNYYFLKLILINNNNFTLQCLFYTDVYFLSQVIVFIPVYRLEMVDSYQLCFSIILLTRLMHPSKHTRSESTSLSKHSHQSSNIVSHLDDEIMLYRSIHCMNKMPP